jgi:hypothetical protein
MQLPAVRINAKEQESEIQLPAARIPMPKRKNYIYSYQLAGFLLQNELEIQLPTARIALPERKNPGRACQ